MTKRRKWWVLMWPNGKLDTEAWHLLHNLALYKTKAAALEEAKGWDNPPAAVRVIIEDDGGD